MFSPAENGASIAHRFLAGTRFFPEECLPRRLFQLGQQYVEFFCDELSSLMVARKCRFDERPEFGKRSAGMDESRQPITG
jgi:hypothetical protein